MAWRETCPVDERTRFMREWEHQTQHNGGRANMSALCRAFGVSRQTGYKWLTRYLASGRDLEVLKDLSRRPKHSPQATPERVVNLILEARRMNPRWGARKLRDWLLRREAFLRNRCIAPEQLPSPSTMGAILRREGVTRPRPRRRRTPASTQPFAESTGPNKTWCVDFKGHFRTQDGTKCYPLTIMDAFSRKLLRCKALRDPDGRNVRKVFESAFSEFGLPAAIRSDNGPPFASVGPGGLSELSVWWLRLGIRHERIAPGKPQQNGRHERMHRTLKEETALPPAATIQAQQEAFNRFLERYNRDRPHEALGGRTPNDFYQQSSRRLPTRIEPFEYPPDCEVRKVWSDGSAALTRRKVKVGQALAGQDVAFRWVCDQRWEVRYGPVTLGIFDVLRDQMIGPKRTKAGTKLKEETPW